jgi:hypothetical protein
MFSRNQGLIILGLLTGMASGTFAVQEKLRPPTVMLPPAATRQVDFRKDVEPILASRCLQCHQGKNPMGDFRLDSRKALEGGLSGKVILPGKSADSLLVKMIAGQIEGKRMPLGGDPLSDEQIGLIRAWIDQGAAWSGDTAELAPTEKHWAYIPPVRPVLPEITQKAWPRNPIDTFVLARLETEGLAPSPEAGRAQLIRRLSLDLIGLPPSIEEVDAFITDKDRL